MKKKIKKVNAAILIIGNEILSGRTQEKNIGFISNWLNINCGISVNEARIIPDDEGTIVTNIKLLSVYVYYILPTHHIFYTNIHIYIYIYLTHDMPLPHDPIMFTFIIPLVIVFGYFS